MVRYNFCPKCGKAIDQSTNPPYCSYCDIKYYRNAKPGASVLPVKDGKVLLARRGKDPHKGSLDIIGGFMEEDELPEEAAIREAKEETGLDVNITSLLGIYVDRYGEDGDYTLNLHYVAEIIDGEIRPMDDVESLEWFDINNPPLDDVVFQNAKDGLRDLREWYKGKITNP